MAHAEFRLPAEWERHSATLLAWPPAESDWADALLAIRSEYRALIEALVEHQPVVLLVRPGDSSATEFLGSVRDLDIIEVPYNDTWCRDYGPVTLVGAGRRLALDFTFDGWGGKYPATDDNRVNAYLAEHELFNRLTFRQYLFELEGGAIDSDGQGRLLVNWHCMKTRHPHLTEAAIEHELQGLLNIDKVLGIDLEPMTGDDTDGHIDTLARFVDADTIIFQTQRERQRTERLRGQLEAMRTAAGNGYRLIALPCPDDVDAGLPASYVNFLFANGACLVPAYDSRQDETARGILAELLPGRDVRSVPASSMIGQCGGPHCATMHIPAPLS